MKKSGFGFDSPLAVVRMCCTEAAKMPHTVTAGGKFPAGHQEEAGRTSNQRDSRGRSDERGTPRIGNSSTLSTLYATS